MKDIKDYLHLYINSEATYSRSFVDDPTAFTLPVRITPKRYFNMMEDFSVHTIKIFLRPLSSMTEDDLSYKKSIFLETDDLIVHENQVAEMFKYMLSRGFDLFGLIESGLAIEKI